MIVRFLLLLKSYVLTLFFFWFSNQIVYIFILQNNIVISGFKLKIKMQRQKSKEEKRKRKKETDFRRLNYNIVIALKMTVEIAQFFLFWGKRNLTYFKRTAKFKIRRYRALISNQNSFDHLIVKFLIVSKWNNEKNKVNYFRKSKKKMFSHIFRKLPNLMGHIIHNEPLENSEIKWNISLIPFFPFFYGADGLHTEFLQQQKIASKTNN